MTTPPPTSPRKPGTQRLIIGTAPAPATRPGLQGQQRAGISSAGPVPPVPPPAKKGMPLRRKLFWGAVALAALWVLGQLKSEKPYMHTTPNRDVPADVFKRPDAAVSQVTPQQTQRQQAHTPAPVATPAPTPVQEAPAETTSVAYPDKAQRISAGQAVLQAFYSAHAPVSGSMHGNMQHQLSRKISQLAVDQPIYENAGVASTKERTYIAMAAAKPGNVAYAFVCAQTRTTITALLHVAVKPNGDGTFEAAVNDKFNHSTRGDKSDYMTGINLMQSYGMIRSCDAALRKLNQEAHGTAETAAIPVPVESTRPYQYDWHK